MHFTCVSVAGLHPIVAVFKTLEALFLPEPFWPRQFGIGPHSAFVEQGGRWLDDMLHFPAPDLSRERGKCRVDQGLPNTALLALDMSKVGGSGSNSSQAGS